MAHIAAVDLEPADRLVRLVRSTLADATLAAFDRNQGFYAIEGMSGARYRWFVNTLLRRLGRATYLEVGSWMGSTLCSAIHGNQVRALAIDNWSQFGGPKAQFLANLRAFRTPEADVEVLESDFRAVPYAALPARYGAFDVYLFDGPHEEQDQFDGLVAALPALADSFVFICDDWNWPQVRGGTQKAIARSGLTLLYQAEIRTTLDDTHPVQGFRESDWHNGYCIAVLQKPESAARRPGGDLRELVASLALENHALRQRLAAEGSTRP
jgi:hypothetical protein